MKYKKSFLLITLLFSFFFISCKARKVNTSDKINIVCSFFPLYDWTNTIIGGLENESTLTMLEKSGTDYHYFEPSQIETELIQNCDILIFNGGESEKWIYDILSETQNKSIITVNCSNILQNNLIKTETSYDEHLWLSIENAITCCKEICKILCNVIPSNSQKYTDNLNEYIEQLENLDLSFKTAVQNGKTNKILFADRFPFSYFARDYKLECYSVIDECTKSKTASEKEIQRMAENLNAFSINCLIILDQSTKDLARKIILEAKNPHCDIFEMDSLQTSSLRNAFNDKTYIYAMQQNLKTLSNALNSVNQ